MKRPTLVRFQTCQISGWYSSRKAICTCQRPVDAGLAGQGACLTANFRATVPFGGGSAEGLNGLGLVQHLTHSRFAHARFDISVLVRQSSRGGPCHLGRGMCLKHAVDPSQPLALSSICPNTLGFGGIPVPKAKTEKVGPWFLNSITSR